jgi:uncharacterized membrane protein
LVLAAYTIQLNSLSCWIKLYILVTEIVYIVGGFNWLFILFSFFFNGKYYY